MANSIHLPVSFYHWPILRYPVTTDTIREPITSNTVVMYHLLQPTIGISVPFLYATCALNLATVWQWFRISVVADRHLHSHCCYCHLCVYSSLHHLSVHPFVAIHLSIVDRISRRSAMLQRTFVCISRNSRNCTVLCGRHFEQ